MITDETPPVTATHVRNDSKVSVSLSTHSNAPLVPIDIKERASALDATPEQNKQKEKAITQNTQPQSNNPQPDYISFFKAKLKDSKLSCLCSFCTIWISVHIVMLLIFFEIITGTLNAIVMFQTGTMYWSVLEFLFAIVTSIIFVLSLRGLYTCNAHFILAQYILLWIRICLPFLRFISAIRIQMITAISLVSFIVGCCIAIYSVVIFRIVYVWAKYFKNNGKYDVNMLTPNNDKTCRLW